MDKPYFIVNPVSGSGLAAQKFKEVSKLLEAKGVDYGFLLFCAAAQRALFYGSESDNERLEYL